MSIFHSILALFMIPLLLTAEPIVSEIAASNDTILADEDGDYGDWIEIHNPDATAVNLAGWFLSDDVLVPTKWTFPSVTIPAGGYLIVFADSKNRAVSGSQLHTNFKLSAGGEYLALVKPDGVTKTTELNEFPAQITDVSYGIVQTSNTVSSELDTSSSYNYLVPSFDVSGWSAAGFDDSSWLSGSGGIGYERDSNNAYDPYITTDINFEMFGRTTAYLRYEFDLTNASAISAMELLAKYDDGFVAYLNGELVGSSNAPASVAWNSSATVSQEATLNAFSIFNLDGETEHLVSGTNVLAIHMLNRFSSSSDFLWQCELKVTSTVPSFEEDFVYFNTPTPGSINNTQPILPSAEVIVSEPSGVKSSAISVTLSTAVPAASIYYTLDGSVPDETSTLYTSPITVSNPAQLRAVSFEVNKTSSKVAVADYSFLDASLLSYLSDVPVLVMDNFGAGSYPDKGRTNDGNGVVQVARQSNVMSFYDVAGNSQPFSASPSLQTRSGCRVRGSSSSGFPRKPLSVELWDDDEDDSDDNSATPFGMSSEADWALYAPYHAIDKTLVHNPVSFAFGELIGALTPEHRLVVVFQNTDGGKVGLSDLAGVYILTEKIERKRAGADFDKLSDDGTEGGWMISVNRLDAIPEGQPSTTVQPNFHTAGPNGVLEVVDDVDGALNTDVQPDDISTFYHSFLNFCEPGGYDILTAQRSVVQSKVRAMDSVLWSAGSGNEITGYPSVIDVDSWVNYYMAQNFSMNQDAIVLSSYLMSRDATSKIEMGPIWDFDRAYAFRGSAQQNPLWGSNRDWYAALFSDVNFNQSYQDAWQEARRTVITDSVLEQLVDDAVAGLRADQIVASGLSYSAWLSEVASMRSWVVDRAQYLDAQFSNTLPTFSPASREFTGSVAMTISPTSGGSIYYTTDGTDPRAWGGGLSSSAQFYSGPLTFTERIRVTFRSWNGAWSGKIVQDYYQLSELPQLVVSEVNYNPTNPSASEAASGYTGSNDFEYIEIQNVGSAVVDLTTLALDVGVEFDFSGGAVTQLQPGARVLVVSNQPAFVARYGSAPQIVGSYTGNLKNSSEQIVLKDKLLDIEFQNFTYDDSTPWPIAADGDGYPLVLKNPTSMPDHTLGENWRSSAYLYGNPGMSDALTTFVGNSTTDSDNDGVAGLLEHYLGTSDLDPAEGGGAGVLSSVTLEADGLLYPTFSVHYALGADDVVGGAEWSSTLAGWDDSVSKILLVSDLPNGDGSATKVWRSTQPFSTTPQFFRLKVSQ